MKEMIKIELERSLRSVAFRVSLIIGMLIVTIQFISVGLHNALNPLEFSAMEDCNSHTMCFIHG